LRVGIFTPDVLDKLAVSLNNKLFGWLLIAKAGLKLWGIALPHHACIVLE